MAIFGEPITFHEELYSYSFPTLEDLEPEHRRILKNISPGDLIFLDEYTIILITEQPSFEHFYVSVTGLYFETFEDGHISHKIYAGSILLADTYKITVKSLKRKIITK